MPKNAPPQFPPQILIENETRRHFKTLSPVSCSRSCAEGQRGLSQRAPPRAAFHILPLLLAHTRQPLRDYRDKKQLLCESELGITYRIHTRSSRQTIPRCKD